MVIRFEGAESCHSVRKSGKWSFGSKAFGGVGEGGADRLGANGQKGKGKDDYGGGGEDAGGKCRAVNIVVQPTGHHVASDWCSDDECKGDEYNEILCQQTGNLSDCGAENAADPNLF